MRVDFLDVGHGSSVVVRSGNQCAIVDAGGAQATTLNWLLRQELEVGDDGRVVIEAVVLTHLHRDHYEGLPALLLSEAFDIRALYANQVEVDQIDVPGRDANSRGNHERDLLDAIDVWREKTGRRPTPLVDGGGFDLGPGVRFTAIWPLPGSGVVRPEHRNRFSIVGRLDSQGPTDPSVVLGGDSDDHALMHLTGRDPLILLCDVLLFPHHGGRPGRAEPKTFASMFSRATQASSVVIQNGRRWEAVPHPEILAGIRESPYLAKVACTQLANCCDDPDPDDRSAPWCAGDMAVDSSSMLGTARAAHDVFVRYGVAAAQCLPPDWRRVSRPPSA